MANLFNIALSRDNVNAKAISEKLEKAKQLPASQKKNIRVGGGIIQAIAQISEKMQAYLGKYKDRYLLLNDPILINRYITESIATGFVAIDTETTGLDTYTDEIVGMSLFSPGMQAAYIPINHISYITNERLPGQVDKDFLKKELNRYIEAGTKTIWFNADFDIRILRHTLGVYFHCWFDTSIASRLLNENEPKGKKGLKDLHKKYVLHNQEDEFKFSSLFEGIQFNFVPIEDGYLYAAKDAEITWELFEFQYQYLNPESDLCKERELQDVANVFWNIEMPCVEVLIDMEDTGIMIDLEVHKKLEQKYLPMMQKAEADFKQRLKDYDIKEDIDIASSQQLAHLFYDLLHLVSPDKKKPRGTSKDIIKKLNHPIVDALKDYRAVSTLVNTFVIALPKEIKSDGKVHCSYKQIGADTGRMACTKPNLQQVPSKAKDIRQMFRASDGYVLIGSDFSQQEPKLTAFLSQDVGLLKAAREGRDVYSSIAAIAFNTTYENCSEFFPEGTPIRHNEKDEWEACDQSICEKLADGHSDTNYAGKNRRTQAKSIVLGELYKNIQMPLYKAICAEKYVNPITQGSVA